MLVVEEDCCRDVQQQQLATLQTSGQSRVSSFNVTCPQAMSTATSPPVLVGSPSPSHTPSRSAKYEACRFGLQVFATAGVSKRISIYEYSAIMANPGAETHCPSQELSTRSKLSCLSWNKYLKTYLASSDYEGVVHVWDIATGQNVAEYEAHEKRIWSVDFCHTDPMLLMSGSDDGMVKVGFCILWTVDHTAAAQTVSLYTLCLIGSHLIIACFSACLCSLSYSWLAG